MARLAANFGMNRYDADQFFKEALDAYKKKNLEDALIKLDQAIALIPHDSEFLATRGFFHLEHGLPDKARTDFENAVQIHPYEMLAHYGRGIMAYTSKNWDEAIAYFTDAWAAKPDRPETQYYLAMSHHRKRENDKALDWMQKALDGFEKANDRRRADAARWIREFEKLIDNNS